MGPLSKLVSLIMGVQTDQMWMHHAGACFVNTCDTSEVTKVDHTFFHFF